MSVCRTRVGLVSVSCGLYMKYMSVCVCTEMQKDEEDTGKKQDTVQGSVGPLQSLSVKAYNHTEA